jgi:O-antigen/teichoic acid export membrane protein
LHMTRSTPPMGRSGRKRVIRDLPDVSVAGLPIIPTSVPTVGPSSSLRGQTARLAAGRIAAAAISMLWFIVAARGLSVDDFGSLALLLGLGLMLGFLADLGLANLVEDVVAHQPGTARRAVARVIAQRLMLAGPTALLVAAAYVVADGEGSWSVPAVFAVSIFATAVYSTFTAAFRALGRAGIDGANEVCSRLLVLALGWSVLAAGQGLLVVVTVYAVADCCSAIGLGVVFARVTRGATESPAPHALSPRRAFGLGATGILGSLHQRIDTWLLALLRSQGAVARYAAAYRLFDGLLLPATAVSALSIPQTAGLANAELRRRLVRLGGLATAVSLPGAVLVLVFAEPILRVVYGSEYEAAAEPLRILAVTVPVSACVLALLPPLALRSARMAGAMAAALVLNVAANLLIIPGYGTSGAALATLAGQVLLLALLAREVRRLGAVSRPGSEPTVPP